MKTIGVYLLIFFTIQATANEFCAGMRAHFSSESHPVGLNPIVGEKTASEIFKYEDKSYSSDLFYPNDRLGYWPLEIRFVERVILRRELTAFAEKTTYEAKMIVRFLETEEVLEEAVLCQKVLIFAQ